MEGDVTSDRYPVNFGRKADIGHCVCDRKHEGIGITEKAPSYNTENETVEEEAPVNTR